jgi:hypothetical protein
MRLGIILTASAICCSCGPAPVKKMSLHDYRQGILDRIADECGLPRATFKLVGDDDLHLKPEPTEEYSKVDCGLQKLKESGIPFKMGFVGNEAYKGNLQ